MKKRTNKLAIAGFVLSIAGFVFSLLFLITLIHEILVMPFTAISYTAISNMLSSLFTWDSPMLSLPFVEGLVLSLLGLIFSGIGKRDEKGKGIATTGFKISIISLAILFVTEIYRNFLKPMCC